MRGDYFDRVNLDLLALLPPDARVVLEIGCGCGALAEAYLRINPKVLWFGIDNNEVATELASRKSPQIQTWTADANESRFGGDFMSESLEQTIDCVVFGDVLEHLINPWDALKRATKNVAAGAQILACIPNVQHWTMIRDLLRGKWTYAAEGLLDRTHLRFFTLDSIRELFDQAGLQVFEIRGRDIGNEKFEAWIAETGIKPTKEMRAYQYIVRAVKPPAEINPIHIHAILGEGCCARPRILEPFAMLSTVPGARCTTGPFIPPSTQVAIVQRPRFPTIDSTAVARGCLERGQILIVELDDDPEAIGVDPLALKAVHAVQVSTEPLAEIVRQWNPNVMVFENQIAELPPMHGPIMDYQTSIFYGAQNRESDWLPIMPALNRILKEHGNKIEVQVIHDRAFFDALKTTEKTFTPFCEYAMYRHILGTCDIALLPLEPGRFNSMKSDLKFIEAAAEGVAVLASNTVYRATCRQLDGYLANLYSTPDKFEFNLDFLISNPNARRGCAENAYAYVRDHRLLSQHFRQRLAWYQELLATKPDLDRQLWDRVPELARRAPVGSLS